MVLPVSGFLPVPLPMMIPFMGAQSLVIGKMFGEGFQYGKRKISAMPNEEFNKLTFEDMMSNARQEIKASVPTMNAAMQDMQPMVEVVVREFFNYVTLVTKIVTGTGEGENIFGKEGGDIGEIIAHALGTHAPGSPAHAGTSPTIPITPPSGTRFTRTLKEAQEDTGSGRGTGRIPLTTPVVRRKAGQTQKIEKTRLTKLVILLAGREQGARKTALRSRSNVNTSKHRKAIKALNLAKQQLTALLNKYRF